MLELQATPNRAMTDLQRFMFSFFNVEIMRRYLPDILSGLWLTIQLALDRKSVV